MRLWREKLKPGERLQSRSRLHYRRLKDFAGKHAPRYETDILRLGDDVVRAFGTSDILEAPDGSPSLTLDGELSMLNARLWTMVVQDKQASDLPRAKAKIKFRRYKTVSKWKEQVGERLIPSHYKTKRKPIFEKRESISKGSTFGVEIQTPFPRSAVVLITAIVLALASPPLYQLWGESYLKRQWWPTAERFQEPQAEVFRGFRKGCRYPQVIEESKKALADKVDSDIPRVILPEIAEKELDELRCAEFYYRMWGGDLEKFGYNVWYLVEGPEVERNGDPLPYRYRFDLH